MPQMFVSGAMVVPTEKDPDDKATIVSIYPRDFSETKITVFPPFYHVKGGTYKEPGITHVGEASWWKVIFSKTDDKDQMIEIAIRAEKIARDVVNDWANSLFGVTPGSIGPGVFVLKGEFTAEQVLKKHGDLLLAARLKQDRWFEYLVRVADQLFARTNGNPLAVSDEMRLAARELGQKSKPWLQNYTETVLTNCVACGAPRNPLFPVCPNCKAVVDVAKAESLGLQFAK